MRLLALLITALAAVAAIALLSRAGGPVAAQPAPAERYAPVAGVDAQRAAEREANRRHELAIAELQARATAQLAPIAVGGGEVQDAQPGAIPAQPRPAKGKARAAILAIMAQYPNRTNAEYAAALGIHPAQVTRALKEK